jgi:hypothetical protein
MKLSYTELTEGIYNPITKRNEETTTTLKTVGGDYSTEYSTTKTPIQQILDKAKGRTGLSSEDRGVPEDQSKEWLKDMAGWKSSNTTTQPVQPTSGYNQFKNSVISALGIDPVTGRKTLGVGLGSAANPDATTRAAQGKFLDLR